MRRWWLKDRKEAVIFTQQCVSKKRQLWLQRSSFDKHGQMSILLVNNISIYIVRGK